jgi:hypothetical protein
MRSLALIAVLIVSGCAANRQYFRPTERQQGHTAQGHPEAIYTLTGPNGQFGEAKIWSRGAYRGQDDASIIHVGIELHNTSGTPLSLHAADVVLDSVHTSAGEFENVRPRAARDRSVDPSAIAETGFEFELPSEIAPGEVDGFLLRWRVHGAGQSYSQRTPFVVHYRRSSYPPVYAYPYYYCEPFDPYCLHPYGYYSPAFGPAYYPRGVIVRVPSSRPTLIVRPRR